MKTRFIHTADWQIGKPFASTEEDSKRVLLQQERINVIGRIAAVARERKAEFILVAGDLFDSASVTKSVVSAACSAIGKMGLPVRVIPGNHDHGGPGSVWDQTFFREEAQKLAPNLQVLFKPVPLEVGNAVVLPCPLARRHEMIDPTAWIRLSSQQLLEKARIVLAHGSVEGFGVTPGDDDELESSTPNMIDLSRLPETEIDYVALGDWHGTKQVGEKAWYSGTPEVDRFLKGEEHDPGNVLVVEVERGRLPQVERIRTGRFGWHEVRRRLGSDEEVGQLEAEVNALTNSRAGEDLLKLELAGSLSIEGTRRLEALLETFRARMLRLKLSAEIVVAPSENEIHALTQRCEDPLTSRVAGRLLTHAKGTGEEAAVAQLALRELYVATIQA